MRFVNDIAKGFFQIGFALANAAPANAVQIRLVDETTKRPRAARFVFVNIIERKAGIETIPPADLDTAT